MQIDETVIHLKVSSASKRSGKHFQLMRVGPVQLEKRAAPAGRRALGFGGVCHFPHLVRG